MTSSSRFAAPVFALPSSLRIHDQGGEAFESMLKAHRAGNPLEVYLPPEQAGALYAVAAEPARGIFTVPTVWEKDGNKERGFDIFSRLMRDRILTLSGPVGESMAAVAVASILFMDAQDQQNSIRVYINSPGGIVTEGLAIYDTLRYAQSQIETMGVGQQASMGSVLMMAGDEPEEVPDGQETIRIGGRFMLPMSRHMFHQPLGGARGQASDIALQADEIRRMKMILGDIYLSVTGLNQDYWKIGLERDTNLSPRHTLAIGGLIHGIMPSEKKPRMFQQFTVEASDYEARMAKVPKSHDEVKDLLTNGGEALRPELMVALSKFEQYWLPGRREMLARLDAIPSPQLVSNNDNKPAL